MWGDECERREAQSETRELPPALPWRPPEVTGNAPGVGVLPRLEGATDRRPWEEAPLRAEVALPRRGKNPARPAARFRCFRTAWHSQDVSRAMPTAFKESGVLGVVTGHTQGPAMAHVAVLMGVVVRQSPALSMKGDGKTTVQSCPRALPRSRKFMNGPSRSVSSCTTSLTAGSHGSTPVPGGAHACRMTSCFSPRAKRTGAVTYPPTPTVIEPVTRGPVRCSAARRGSGNAAVAVCRLKHAFAELAQARPAVQRTHRRHAAIPCSATFPVKGGELAGAVGDLAAAVCWQGTAQNPTQSSAGSVQVKRRQANCKTAPPLRNAV